MGLMLFCFILTISSSAFGFSDIGKWDLPLSGDQCGFTLAKSLFQGSKLVVRLNCNVASPTNVTINYQWTQKACSPDYYHYYEEQVIECRNRFERSLESNNNNDTAPSYNTELTHTCHSKETIPIYDEKINNPKNPTLLKVEKDGIYMFEMVVTGNGKLNGSIHVEMLSPHGYLSAAIWPLLPFFGTMCAVYTVLCLCWLGVCALQWRDLLRIQYWIGGVALLGMLETSTYYGVYSAVNSTGNFSIETYMFAELMSIGKRSLARMLVIIVSLGFGIVKPRLGPALQRVVGVGCVWGVLAGIEAWLRLHQRGGDSNKNILLAETPLSLLDAAVCWWVFVSLAHTMRTLQLRRNAVKLSLYKHFTNTLIFAVISSVVFMLYSIKSYRVIRCITEWKGVWVDEAYWHLLFAAVLAAIMVLWRPTRNNQRYAFTPLLDNAEDDDDEEEQFVNDAYGVKMRGTSISGGGGEGGAGDKESLLPDARSTSLEADLRWVEENIPTSTLPLLDSDEEIINTKFEVSKMQ